MTRSKALNHQFLHSSKINFDAVAFIIILFFALLSFRGAFYGIASPDESFYLTIPYRIIQGDALLIDEFHASQFSSFLLWLPMKIFLKISGSTDGIVLYFRCLYLLCQTAVSLFTYNKIKKYGFTCALISALMFLLYVPENVHMLDYYTMSLMGIHVATLLLFTENKHTVPKLVFIGIVFACSVTAQPFNSIIYFIYCIFVLYYSVFKNKKVFDAYTEKILAPKNWIFITVGIIMTAAVFLVFLLSQASSGELISNFKNIFGGYDHTLPFSDEGPTDMFSYITLIKTLFGFTPVSFTVSLALILVIAFDKKRQERKKIWLFVSLCVIGVYFIASIATYFITPNEILFRPYPLFLFTFICLMLQKTKNKELFAIWLTGVLYTVSLGIISQALDYIGVIGCVISNTALMPAAKQLYKEIKEDEETTKKEKGIFVTKKVLCTFTAVLALSMCAVNIVTGTAIKFTDDALAPAFSRELFTNTVTAEEGPLKGINMSKDIHNEYKEILNDLETINNNTNGRILIAGLIPWAYFCFDEPPAAFTTWYISGELMLYEGYYEEEEHRPSCIYVPDTTFFWNRDNKATASNHSRFFRNMFSCDISQGKAGKILYVRNMR